jgi:uncharacterized small protein (DUF1192 family)
MIFLITKMFVYLLLAGAIGAAGGWLFRNLQAQRSEENALRAAHDAKSKVPQLESLLRGRDEQITKLKDILQEKQSELSEQGQAMQDLEKKARDHEREASRWQQSAQAKEVLCADTLDVDSDAVGEADELIAELAAEIARLKAQLAQTSAAQSVVPAQANGHADAGDLAAELESLRAQLNKVERQLKDTHSDLMQEQNKVTELERERELQNKSLQVLHQQLELERTRRVANG